MVIGSKEIQEEETFLAEKSFLAENTFLAVIYQSMW